MAVNVIMPAMGATQETGRLVRWFKQEGDSVSKGEMLMEVETDKSVVEVEAPASGVLSHVTAAPDEEVPVGQTIALIIEAGEQTAPARTTPAPPGRGRRQAPARKATKPRAAATTEAGNGSETGRTLASPAAKRLAKEKASI